MNKDETIRIAAVENGFVVDTIPDPNFIGRANRQPDDYVASSVCVFESIESLMVWLSGHFTYRPDAPSPYVACGKQPQQQPYQD